MAGIQIDGVNNKIDFDDDLDTSISASTDDTLVFEIAGSTDFTMTANTFTAASGSTITTPTLGVISAKDLGVGLHIKEADSGVSSVSTDADQLVIENSAESGISLLAGTSSASRIAFGDSDNSKIGMVYYNHSSNYMNLTTNDAERIRIHSSGMTELKVPDSANTLQLTPSGTNASGTINFNSPGTGSGIFKVGDTETMRISSIGAVTKPLQPAFLASPASQQSNLTNNTTLLFGTEITDRNADFNGGNGTFTAPVTGLYQVGYSLRLQEVPNDTNYVMVEITSSNRNYYNIIDTGVFDQEAAYYEFNGNYLIDMDANDTYFIRYIQSGGTTSTDMSTASYSFGTLAC